MYTDYEISQTVKGILTSLPQTADSLISGLCESGEIAPARVKDCILGLIRGGHIVLAVGRSFRVDSVLDENGELPALPLAVNHNPPRPLYDGGDCPRQEGKYLLPIEYRSPEPRHNGYYPMDFD